MNLAFRLERQLEAAQEITHIGSWEWDLASGSVTWSDELYRIYGLAPRSCEITLDSFIERVHPEDRERIGREIGAAMERGGRFSHRERIVRPDGSVRDLDTVGEVVSGPDGRPTGLIGTCRDITEERRREEMIALYADVVAGVQIGLSVWRLDDPRDPASLRLVAFNPAMEASTGVSLASAVGQTMPAIFPEAMTTELPPLLGTAKPVSELATYRFDPSRHAPIFAVKAFALPDACYGLALEDVTARVHAQQLQAAERRALEMLASGAAIGEILTVLVKLIEELIPDTAASILLLDESGEHVLLGAAPSLPDAFNRAIHGSPIGPNAGSCGTAAFRRAAVYVSDIESDPLWADYRDLARAHGLRACWSTPILANDGRVIGTFAMYYRQPKVADEASRDLVARATHVAGIAIERRRLDEQLAALPARMESVREDERTGIAREIHDELGQALTALKMDIAWVARRVRDADDVTSKLGEMTELADQVIQSVRRISAELRPGILDDLGLSAAIEWQADEFAARHGIACTVRSKLGELRLDRGLATAVFRIFQEALTNIARHASATQVDVHLRLERGQLRLDVEDDGVGLTDAAHRNGGLGLLGMRERARRLGGDCTITRRTGRGTAVSLIVPLRFPADRAAPPDDEI
jgi:PAS domain S-box-containing protein